MLINSYVPYVVPYDQFDQFCQFSGYYSQYPVRTDPLFPSYYPLHHHSGERWGDWVPKLPPIKTPTINLPPIKTPTINLPPVKTPAINLPPVKTPAINLPPISCGFTGYKTNKFDLKANVESGGWVAAWSDDIAEKDVLQGVVAAGVSVVGSNPGPFLAWVDYLVNRTISSLSSSVQRRFTAEIRSRIQQLTADVIRDAIQGRSAHETLRQFDTFDFKAGAIRYSGKNVLCNQTVSNTWGMKPYVAFRIR